MEVTIELATTTESEEGELVPDRRWKFWPIVPKHLPIRRRTRKHNQNPVVLSNKDPSNRVRPTSNGVATPQAKEILSPVQRLRQREFMSKKNLRLVEQNDYDQCLIDKRDVLWQYVHDISHDSDAARVSRNLIERYSATFDLVSVQSADLKRITPYICVYGVPDDEILKLHAALSKTEFRSQYKELSLCYDTNPVIGHASKKPMSGMDISDLTLCGRTAIFKDGAGYQTRTIAFLLESVALKSSSSPDYYALTAFHGSDIAHKDTPPEVHLDDLLEDESSFESDVSSALIVTGKASALVRVPPDDSSSGDNIDNPDISISSIPSTQIGLGTANFPLNEIYTGREWSLVSIKDPLLCLPNAVRFPVIQTRSDENDTEAYYLNNDSIVTSPKTAEVVVIAGVSGQHTARLRQRSIQINFQGSGMIEAWVVQFPGVCPLVKGDSGSPVIDAKTRRAYGYIFASTGNRAFLRPLHHAISEIQKQITSTVRLPSPFQCLAEVSRHYPKTGSSSSTAELFALEAIGKRALLASSGTRTVDIYRKNWKNPLNRTTLAWLVTKTGSNAFSTTAKDAKFWSDAMEMRDNNPQFDYELLKSLFSEDGPPGEEQIVVTPISQDQSQVSASQTVLTSAVMPSVPAERETPANIFVNKLPRVRKRLKNFRTTLTATRAGRNSTSKPNNDVSAN
ncbi:hypothetical protein EJ08DRAFT_462026 [Tothia fuscella]|uniref:Uncharacterized protein n=1 Tax=Tothia fuscella TaxID=1048955 RepID=A0A9P4TU77_9PEZI|nr:hypothetical protein EJ08DRAFT_462026 [Tothia fuscella]